MPFGSQYTKNKKTRAKWRIGTDCLQYVEKRIWGSLEELNIHSVNIKITSETLLTISRIDTASINISGDAPQVIFKSSTQSENKTKCSTTIRYIYGVKL